MLIGYNQATSMKHSCLETDIKMCKKYGFDGLEMQTALMDKYMESHTFDDLHKLFINSGVKALPVNAFCNFNVQKAENTERLHYLCRCAQASGADAVVLVPALREVTLAKTVDSIIAHKTVTDKYDIKLALEFLGFAECSVNSLEDALKIAGLVDGLGLVLDCAHTIASTTKLSTILELKPWQIMAVHINDLPEKSTGVYSDADRVWPGDGNEKLIGIINNLKAIKYDGIFSVELFNEEIWELPIDEIFSTAMRKTKIVLSESTKL